jgi:hypothetical protein
MTDDQPHPPLREVLIGISADVQLLAAQTLTKAQKRSGAKRARPAGRRDLVRRPKASAYAKRTARGRFKEMDDVGRSQKVDKPRKAKKTVRSGYGDQGDERPRSTRRARR